MKDEDDQEILWHTGLFARPDSTFPKKCPNCGRVFENAEQYFTETEDIKGKDRGLKSYDDESTATIVEAFRNCPCGSTLMEVFDDHREETQARLAEKEPELARPTPARASERLSTGTPVDVELGLEFTGMFADEPGPWSAAWHDGLQPSGDAAFPKECRNCGRVFETAEQFFTETSGIRGGATGLKESLDEQDAPVVEAFRNCPCGSTMMDNFANRRDNSTAGQERRERFARLLSFLVESGIDSAVARGELLKVVRGGESELLSRIRPPSSGGRVSKAGGLK